MLILCPAVRGVALEEAAHKRRYFLRCGWRRVTLDLDGATAQPAVLQEALASGIPVLRPAAAWPPSFEVAPPDRRGECGGASVVLRSDGADELRSLKSKPEYRAAREVGLWLAAAQQSNLGGSEYVASARRRRKSREAHRVRKIHAA